MQQEINSFKVVREGNKADEIKTAMEAFTQKVYEIFGKLYQNQGGQGQATGAEQGPQGPAENPDGSFNADGDVH